MTMALETRTHLPAAAHDGRLAPSLRSFGREWLQLGIAGRFFEMAAQHADRVAIDDGKTQLTYEQVGAAVAHLAARIHRSVPAGQPVGILLTNGTRWPVAMLACIAAGRPYVPLDSAAPVARSRELAKDAGVGLILTVRSDQDAAIDGTEVLDIEESMTASGGSFKFIRPQGPVAILYTSGSTNRPKGVCYDERVVLERVAHEVTCCNLGPDDRIFLVSPVSTIVSLRTPLSALLTGATLCIADSQRRGISEVLEFFANRHITYGFAIPGVLRSFLGATKARDAFRAARVIRVGGDVFRAGDLELCRAVLPATCSIFVTLTSTEAPAVCEWSIPPDWRPDGASIPVGFPRQEIGFDVVSENGAPVGPGEIGELVIRSPYLSLGYWRGGAVEYFARSEAEPDARTFSTGDMVRLRPDGLVEMTGRKDRQVKIRGLRVNPAEVEAAVQECDGVADAAVISRATEPDSSELIAYVVPRADARLSLPDDLHRLLAARIPDQMVPRQIRLITAIPRLPNGKQNHQGLARLDRQDQIMINAGTVAAGHASNALANSSAPDRARIRDIVGRNWTAVLSRRSFQADIPWGAAGGDSLGAMQLWLRIEEELKTRLPLAKLDVAMSPSQLISVIENALHTSVAAESSIRSDELPLIYFMPPYDGDAPSLARFRAMLSDKFRFAVIEYPSWREMAKLGASFDLIVGRAADQILAQCRAHEVFIAGYSFGGCVAWEVARRIEQAGVRVKFVGLIDSRLGAKAVEGSVISKTRRILRLLVRDRRSAVESVALGLAGRLIDGSAFATLRAASRVARLISRRALFMFDWHVANQLRLKSLQKWKLGPAQIPTALFCSDEVSEDCPDLGWGEICKRLSVIPVGGSHFSILAPPHREVLCERFAEAAVAAWKGQGAAASPSLAEPVREVAQGGDGAARAGNAGTSSKDRDIARDLPIEVTQTVP